MRHGILFILTLLHIGGAVASVVGQPPQPKDLIDVPAFRKALREKLAAGKTEQAIAFFKDTMKAAKAPARKSVRDEFLRDMARAGKPVEAYRAFPGGKDSFRVLAEQLVGSGRTTELNDLIKEHATFFDDDAHINLYRGQLAFEAKKYAEADVAWNAAFKMIKDDWLAELYHCRRVLARHGAGKTLEALAEIPPVNTTFSVLADRLVEQKKPAELDKLIAAFVAREKFGPSHAMNHFMKMHEGEDVATLVKAGQLVMGDGGKYDRTERQIYSYLASHGRAMDAYLSAPDKKKGFADLYPALHYSSDFATRRGLIDAHRKMEPEDPETDRAEAELFLDMNQLDKAIAIFKKVLKKEPANHYSPVRQKYLEACLAAGKGIDAFKELGSNEEDFRWLAILCASHRDAAGLAAILKAHPPGDAFGEKFAAEYELKLKILNGKTDEAVKSFLEKRKESAEPKKKRRNPFGEETPDREAFHRRSEEQDFMREMAATGQGMPAYKVAAFPEESFATLARHYRENTDQENLAKLIALHQGKFPLDPALPLNIGYLKLMRGHADAAGEIFQAELAKPMPTKKSKAGFGSDESFALQSYRAACTFGLRSAIVRQGRTAEQYRIAGGGETVFRTLAIACIQEKAGAELEALIAVHRKGHPQSPDLRRYEGEAAFLKGDYQAAWKLLNDFDIDRNFKKSFTGDNSAGSPRGRSIVCLVRLKRYAEAVRAANAWEADRPITDPTAVVLAHAAAGDVEQTLRLIQIHTSRYHWLDGFYRDEDLGPLLRSDAMAKVRERFPNPVKN